MKTTKELTKNTMKTAKTNKVIIRSDRAGVFYGELKSQTPMGDKLMVEMVNCRRLWYWSGAASLSQLAMEGVAHPDACKFTVVVPLMTIVGVVEIIPCTANASENIEAVKIWKI